MQKIFNQQIRVNLSLLLLIAILGSSCKFLKSTDRRMLQSLEGSWENVEKEQDSRHVEHWKMANDSVMNGKGILTTLADTVFTETLKIIKVDGNWYYVAEVPENPLPVFFKMDVLTKDGFTATNPHHDFPKYISYSMHKKELHAEVSDGKERVISFDFVKIK